MINRVDVMTSEVYVKDRDQYLTSKAFILETTLDTILNISEIAMES